MRWLSQARNKPNSIEQLLAVAKWVFYISLPIFLSFGYLFFQRKSSFRQFIRLNQLFVYSLLVCIIASITLSYKIGVVENNNLPFIPLLAYLLALVLEQIQAEQANIDRRSATRFVQIVFLSAALAFMVTMPLAIVPEAARLASTLVHSPYSGSVSDINRIIETHPGMTIGMGFSDGYGNYQRTYYRPLLVFAGNPYLVDAVVMFEMEASGVNPVPKATINALQTCQTQLWLLPKVTKQPFDVRSYYPPYNMVFSEAFRSTFLKHYQFTEESEFYDLWTCKS